MPASARERALSAPARRELEVSKQAAPQLGSLSRFVADSSSRPPPVSPKSGPRFQTVFHHRQLSEFEFERQRSVSRIKLRDTWAEIQAKYGSVPPEEDDEVDIFSGDIVVDRGHVRNLETRDFAGGAEYPDSDEEGDDVLLRFSSAPPLSAPRGPDTVLFGEDEDELGDWGDRSGLDPQHPPMVVDQPWTSDDIDDLHEFLRMEEQRRQDAAARGVIFEDDEEMEPRGGPSSSPTARLSRLALEDDGASSGEDPLAMEDSDLEDAKKVTPVPSARSRASSSASVQQVLASLEKRKGVVLPQPIDTTPPKRAVSKSVTSPPSREVLQAVRAETIVPSRRRQRSTSVQKSGKQPVVLIPVALPRPQTEPRRRGRPPKNRAATPHPTPPQRSLSASASMPNIRSVLREPSVDFPADRKSHTPSRVHFDYRPHVREIPSSPTAGKGKQRELSAEDDVLDNYRLDSSSGLDSSPPPTLSIISSSKPSSRLAPVPRKSALPTPPRSSSVISSAEPSSPILRAGWRPTPSPSRTPELSVPPERAFVSRLAACMATPRKIPPLASTAGYALAPPPRVKPGLPNGSPGETLITRSSQSSHRSSPKTPRERDADLMPPPPVPMRSSTPATPSTRRKEIPASSPRKRPAPTSPESPPRLRRQSLPAAVPYTPPDIKFITLPKPPSRASTPRSSTPRTTPARSSTPASGARAATPRRSSTPSTRVSTSSARESSREPSRESSRRPQPSPSPSKRARSVPLARVRDERELELQRVAAQLDDAGFEWGLDEEFGVHPDDAREWREGSVVISR